MFGQKRVAGSVVGGRSDMVEMLRFAAAKGVKPMVEEWPLEKVGWTELQTENG